MSFMLVALRALLSKPVFLGINVSLMIVRFYPEESGLLQRHSLFDEISDYQSY